MKRGLAHKFHGPFKVLAKLPNGVDYLIRKADSQNSRKFVIHHNRLKKYFGTANEGSHNDVDMRTIKTEGTTTRQGKRTYKKNPKCTRWLKENTKATDKTVQQSSDKLVSSDPESSTESSASSVKPSTSGTQVRSRKNMVAELPDSSTDEETAQDGINEHNNKDICKVCKKESEELPMIACDNCQQWYHFKCQNIRRRPKEETDWFCKQCKQNPKLTVKFTNNTNTTNFK